ncbi:MAG: 3'-5' exonuclease [Myxococcota bacterium]
MSRPFVIIDLEATCDERRFPRDQMETIEIGAVLVDADTLAPIDTFQTFVKPVVRPWLTPFCTQLTHITQADVDAAEVFPFAIDALAAWLPGPTIFGSWGAYDKLQLLQDARRHGIDLPLDTAHHFNVKNAFAKATNTRRCGMAAALKRAGLTLEGTHHRGLDDARNITKLLPFALGRSSLVDSAPKKRRSRR